eukprot:gene30404-36734_t
MRGQYGGRAGRIAPINLPFAFLNANPRAGDDPQVIFEIPPKTRVPFGVSHPDCPCGYAGCATDTIFPVPTIPPDKASYMSTAEVEQLIKELNDNFTATTCPECPGFLCNLIVPFSGICLTMHYQNKRKMNMRAIVQKWNEQTLAGRRELIEMHPTSGFVTGLELISDEQLPAPSSNPQQPSAMMMSPGMGVPMMVMMMGPSNNGGMAPMMMPMPMMNVDPAVMMNNAAMMSAMMNNNAAHPSASAAAQPSNAGMAGSGYATGYQHADMPGMSAPTYTIGLPPEGIYGR